MISVPEANALDGAKFTPAEDSMLALILKKAEEVIRRDFDGLGAYLTIPAEMATSRVVAEASRRISAPASDGSRWIVSLHFNIGQGRPSLIKGASINVILLSYLLIIAVDPMADNILRVRRETMQTQGGQA